MDPKISVCIPTYNSEKYLKETIESVLAQTYPDFELIISDDASTDRTLDIIRSFKDSRISLFCNTENKGIVENWNQCIRLAKNPWINIFHADDLMGPNYVSRVINFLKTNPNCGFVFSNAFFLNQRQEKTSSAEQIFMFSKGYPSCDTLLTGQAVFKRLLLEGNLICCPAVTVARAAYEKLGSFDRRFSYCLDYEMWGRISLFYDVGYLAGPLIQYRWHETNTSHDFDGFQRRSQEMLTRRIMLENYHIKAGNFLSKKEIHRLVFDDAHFYFSHDKKQDTRDVFRLELKLIGFQFRSLVYYMASFLPSSFIRMIRKLKQNSLRPALNFML